jgi:hypothetical protein
MLNLKTLLASAIVALSVAGCSVTVENKVTSIVTDGVKRASYDPESLKIHRITTVLTQKGESDLMESTGNFAITCAELNGKNRLGAYVGSTFNVFVSDITDPANITILDQADDKVNIFTDEVNEKYTALAKIFPKSVEKCKTTLRSMEWKN